MGIINFALRTGYSFRETFGHVELLFKFANQDNTICFADKNNTFSHYYLEIESEKKGFKPVYGIRFDVVEDAGRIVKPRGQYGEEFIFIAKNVDGLAELYELLKTAYDNFYYRPNVSYKHVKKLSGNIYRIAEYTKRPDLIDYVALSPTTPLPMIKTAIEEKIPFVASSNNRYALKDDLPVYEVTGQHSRGGARTYPQHILTFSEWQQELLDKGIDVDFKRAFKNSARIYKNCQSYKLPKAPMIKAKGKASLEYLCYIGAKKRGINLKKGKYKKRYERELSVIKERGFENYFLVVADIVKEAKEKMLVGPARGSSGGSLICYLIGITEIDPLKFGLLFERFIDITRSDLPDIDIDFPDIFRASVIKKLKQKYGSSQVTHIANISRLQGRSAIGNFAKALGVPIVETEAVKNSLIERRSGDSRAHNIVEDTLKTTESGKQFIENFPSMLLAGKAENHPDHSSVHAAGIIVCNQPVHKYVGVNSKDNIAMVDKVAAEYQNLLKIDILGLRTLSILATCADMLGMNVLDYYDLPLDDKKTYKKIFKQNRLNGIFQFDGFALSRLTQEMGAENFDDLVALTALARPGALYSGGAARYIKLRHGREKPTYKGKEHKKATKETFGIVVYQEQMLRILREIGGLDWGDVNKLRKALSKSLGDEAFEKYKEQFLNGASKRGYEEEDAEFIWDELRHAGNYAFNKSHAVAYSLISYWTAYMKTHYPLEFVVACLRHQKDKDSSIKILREAVEKDGIEYLPIDPENSEVEWSVKNGKIVGGLTNIDGIGIVKAQKIIKCRNGVADWTPSLKEAIENPVTDFDTLWPCRDYYGAIYEDPMSFELVQPCSKIIDIKRAGEYIFLGKLKRIKVIDLNDYSNIQKRGGEVLKGETLELALTIEDDTESINIKIWRKMFEEFGREIVEQSEEDEDFYVVHAEWSGKYIKRLINIAKIEQHYPPGDKIPF